jgi:hypothetical protein
VSQGVRLVGDGIESPANARALIDAAAMFGAGCRFRDTRGLAARWDAGRGGQLDLIDTPDLLDQSRPIVAVENSADAASVFGASLKTSQSSVVVGGERLGIRADVLRAARETLQIPMSGRGVNTLNVAAAAAVALYYLLAARGLTAAVARRPEERRPALLLVSPTDHVEAGSAIRSAAAFGWRTVGLEDSNRVWFGGGREVIAEGRAAARSHRNFTRVLPMRVRESVGFRRVVIAGARIDGPPLRRVNLARRDTLLVIPDEGGAALRDVGGLDEALFARIDLPVRGFPYRYRLVATIAIAEAARQTGLRPAGQPMLRGRRGLTYESVLSTVSPTGAQEVDPAELRAY